MMQFSRLFGELFVSVDAVACKTLNWLVLSGTVSHRIRTCLNRNVGGPMHLVQHCGIHETVPSCLYIRFSKSSTYHHLSSPLFDSLTSTLCFLIWLPLTPVGAPLLRWQTSSIQYLVSLGIRQLRCRMPKRIQYKKGYSDNLTHISPLCHWVHDALAANLIFVSYSPFVFYSLGQRCCVFSSIAQGDKSSQLNETWVLRVVFGQSWACKAQPGGFSAPKRPPTTWLFRWIILVWRLSSFPDYSHVPYAGYPYEYDRRVPSWPWRKPYAGQFSAPGNLGHLSQRSWRLRCSHDWFLECFYR